MTSQNNVSCSTEIKQEHRGTVPLPAMWMECFVCVKPAATHSVINVSFSRCATRCKIVSTTLYLNCCVSRIVFLRSGLTEFQQYLYNWRMEAQRKLKYAQNKQRTGTVFIAVITLMSRSLAASDRPIYPLPDVQFSSCCSVLSSGFRTAQKLGKSFVRWVRQCMWHCLCMPNHILFILYEPPAF